MDQSRAPAYRLVRRPPAGGQSGAGPPGPPRLDQAQQQVVDHAGGPLLVLAGPGTGKTTTIVAAVADRIENRGIAPERILVLTFSRKAAAELRERITARLQRTTREPLAVTFHSYAYALARREFVLAGDEPPRLLSAPEQLLEIRRMLKGEAQDGGSAGRSGSGPRSPPAVSPRKCATCCCARPSAASTAAACASWASTKTVTTGPPRPGSSTGTRPASTSRRSRPTTTPRSSASRPPCSAARRPGSASAAPTTWCWSTSTRTATRRRSRC